MISASFVGNDALGEGKHFSGRSPVGGDNTAGTARNDVSGTLDTGSAAIEAQVRRLIALRLSRHRLFEENLFFDPAWDMLLELYAAQLAGKFVSRAELCVLSRTPSTALRWVELLDEMVGWCASH